MFIRVFFSILLFSLCSASTKKSCLYFPLFGYHTFYETENNESSKVQGAQIGLFGYTISEDFSLEVNGLAYFETAYSEEEVPSSSPVTSPVLRSKSCPSLHSSIQALQPFLRSTTTESSPVEEELCKNPWKPHDPSPLASTYYTQTAMQNSAVSLPNNSQEAPKPKQYIKKAHHTVWTGFKCTGKFTFLHLPPHCQLYFAPGLIVLKPWHTKEKLIGLGTISLGMRCRLRKKWLLDISCTHPLKTWNRAPSSSLLVSYPNILMIALRRDL